MAESSMRQFLEGLQREALAAVALQRWRSRLSDVSTVPRQLDEILASMRADVRANLLDHGLLQLVMEDSAPERLPSLFRVSPVARALSPALKHGPAQLSSLRARLQALVNRYAECCKDAGLNGQPSRTVPWAYLSDTNADLLRSAVALEIVEALTDAGDSSSQ